MKGNSSLLYLGLLLTLTYVLVTPSSVVSEETHPTSYVAGKSLRSTEHKHTLDFTVPPEQVDQVESKEQRDAWEKVASDCLPIEIGATPSGSCLDSMSQYFLNEPVWKYSTMDMYDNKTGRHRVVNFPLNLRHARLAYSSADYIATATPYWRDIFDGRIQSRKDLVSDVVEDPSCKNLGDSKVGGIQRELASWCHGRELFKYATYLSGCTTAIERLHVLNSTSGLTKDRGARQYEVSLKLIEEAVEPSMRELALRRLQRGYLHSSWMVNQCGEFGKRLLDESRKITEVADNGAIGVFWDLPHESFYGSIQQIHRLTLTISAKTGDEWGIRSYPLTWYDGTEFRADMLKVYPILVHRHLGSRVGGFSRELSKLDQRRHRAKAYLLMKDELGSQIAEREFDVGDLKMEIDYIKQGGLLEMPRDREEIMREVIDQAREYLPDGTFPDDLNDLH